MPAGVLARAAVGAAAGALATVPMTLVMQALHRRLPAPERYPLPPREITEELMEEAAEAADAPPPSEETLRAATLVAHYGYGAATGAAYAVLLGGGGSPVARGAAWGLAVWAGSYLGLLPAAGILKPATEHPARRNALMIAAHLVWGPATALLTHAALQSADKGDYAA